MLNFFSFRTLAIIKREFKAQVFTKTFIFTTIFVPIIMFGLMGLQIFLTQYEDKKEVNIEIVVADSSLISPIEKAYDKSEDISHKKLKLVVSSKSKQEFEKYLTNSKPKLLTGEVNGIFFLPVQEAYQKKLEYYSKNPKNQSVTQKIRALVNDVLIARHFAAADLSKEDIEYARNKVSLQNFKITEEKEIKKDNYGAYILAFVLAFLLYLSLIMIGMQILKAVVEEKENRVVEVLLSSVHASELMTAKIIATTAVGVLQIFIWMLPFIVTTITGLAVLPEKLQFTITLFQISYFILNYAVGLVTFLGLYAAAGAIFDNMSEAQQGAMPIMFLILIPFYICFSMINNPTNSIAEISSMVPFASIIVMPVRMSIVDVPLWQIGVALGINVATLLFIFSFVGKIYRIGLLKTGSRPKWKEIYQWARQ